jgi:GTPase
MLDTPTPDPEIYLHTPERDQAENAPISDAVEKDDRLRSVDEVSGIQGDILSGVKGLEEGKEGEVEVGEENDSEAEVLEGEVESILDEPAEAPERLPLPMLGRIADEDPEHVAGFVSIIGRPNAGKSTLLNALLGQKLSAVTFKAQTTRHRIFGIDSGAKHQIVYSDTPGILEASYELHRQMMSYVRESLEDADILIMLVDANEQLREEQLEALPALLKRADAPIYLVLNKTDICEAERLAAHRAYYQKILKVDRCYEISALTEKGVAELRADILAGLPHHPPYFDTEQLSDRSERFFASELIREQIFLNYREEVPYACEVVIEAFKEEETIIRVRAEVLVERTSQKGIIIGAGGEALKKTATEARLAMEAFFNKKIFLEVFVKVKPDWRNQKAILRQLGYGS